MCTECGCSAMKTTVSISSSDSSSVRALEVRQRLLSKNEQVAQQNRALFQRTGLRVLNLMSSPGSGKTTLIEQTAQQWPNPHSIGTIVGDLATDNDARRLQSAGVRAVQIRTGTGCHLEAEAIAQSLLTLDLQALDVLFIENVGNLVCPAAYDLGETLRVVLLSVTEGEDKPQKYPTAFQAADIVILTKIDLAQAVGFDRATAIANIQMMSPQAQLLELSARTGDGMKNWLNLLNRQVQTHQIQTRPTAGT